MEACSALIFGILSDPGGMAGFNLLHSITNDHWAFTVSTLRYFTFTKFYLLKSHAKDNLLALVRRIVALSGKGVDGLIVGLVRQIRPGDHGCENTQLTTALLRLLGDHQDWFFAQPGLIPFVFYPLVRVCAEEGVDHALLHELAEFCAACLKSRYRECTAVGRDFARALLAVSHLEAFQPFWAWFVKPGAEAPAKAAPIAQVLAMPSQKKYLATRLTPLMETEIVYMMEHVKAGRQTFYESWFQDMHVPRGPSDDPSALIADLLRYIVAVYHPSNAVLASSVVQRWATITWLYRLIISEKAAFDALLAVYMDWFFFDPNVDSIMTVEPGCLVITKGLVRLPALTIGALSYLGYYRHQFPGIAAEDTMRCIDLAMKVCIEKGVIRSLEGVLMSPSLEPASKTILAALFPSTISIQAPSAGSSADPRVPEQPGSSKSTAPAPSPSAVEELDTCDESEAERMDVEVDRAELLMEKIRALSTSACSDQVILGLLSTLRATIEELYRPAKEGRARPPLSKALSFERFVSKQNARIRALVQIESGSSSSASLPAAAVELPLTAADFNRYKARLLNALDSMEFPADNFDQLVLASLAKSPTEQIWMWKSLVLLIQRLPLAKVQLVAGALRSVFELISEEQEVLSTGLEDSLMALHARIPVIPKIFDGVTVDTDTFRTFVEQSLVLSAQN